MPLCLSSPDSFAHLVEALLLQRIAGDTLAQISGRLLSIREIFVDFFLVVQTVGNAEVNISQFLSEPLAVARGLASHHAQSG